MLDTHLMSSIYDCKDKPESEFNFVLNVYDTLMYFQLTHKVVGEEPCITLEVTCKKWRFNNKEQDVVDWLCEMALKECKDRCSEGSKDVFIYVRRYEDVRYG